MPGCEPARSPTSSTVGWRTPRPGWSTSTLRQNRGVISVTFKPLLGHLAVNKLTTIDIDDVYRCLLSPVAPRDGHWRRARCIGLRCSYFPRDPARARDRDGGLRPGPALRPARMCGQRQRQRFRVLGSPSTPQRDLMLLDRAETVVVPGYEDVDGTVSTTVLDTLQAAHARRARLVSICTGAFALAAAGILDGRPATTHWRWADDCSAATPCVNVVPNRLFVDDGDVLTSAGVTTGIDLCLHIIRRDHGAAAANSRARALVAPPQRQGGQAQFVERLRPEASGDQLAALRDWMLENMALPLDLDTLARHAHMSRRTLTRRFREETGLPPMAMARRCTHRPRPRAVGDHYRTRREHRPPDRTWRSRLCPRRLSQASRHLAQDYRSLFRHNAPPAVSAASVVGD